MKFKKVLASTLSAAMVLSCGFNVMADEVLVEENAESNPQITVPADTAGHWAEDVMLRAAGNGILAGNGEGYNPDGKLTRAELAAFMTRAFNATVKKDISDFTDIDTGAWYADDVAEAVNMKILSGSDNAMRPNDFVTRQEAIAVFARAICLEAGTTDDIAAFSDASLVADWALSDVAAMVKSGYIEGSDGKLSPTATMSRAEFAVILDKAAKVYVEEGTFEENVDGSLMIKNADVTVKDSVVSGNVIIGDGVGEGDATLDGVTVKGNIIVRGGGVNSVKLVNGTVVEGDIVVNNVNSAVRLYADSLSDVIASIDANTPVILDGIDADTVIANADVEVASGTVKEMEINADGVSISGDGKIEKAIVNADNVTIDNKGVEVEIAEGVTGTVVNGKEIDPGETPDKPFVPGGNVDPDDDQEIIQRKEIAAVPAPLHDTRTENAIPDDKLFTADSYKVNAFKAENKDYAEVYISAANVKYHQNAQPKMGFWVGVGIPAPKDFTEWSGVEYKFDDAADFTAANTPGADYIDENGSYMTVYFDAGNTEKVRKFTVKWNDELTETYQIDFSDVTIDLTMTQMVIDTEKVKDYTKDATFTLEPISYGKIEGEAAPYDQNLITYTCKLTGTLNYYDVLDHLTDFGNYSTDFIRVLIPVPKGATHIQYSDGLVNPSQNLKLTTGADYTQVDNNVVEIGSVKYLEINMQYVLSDANEETIFMNGNAETKIGKVFFNFNDGTNSVQKVYYKFDCTGLTFDNSKVIKTSQQFQTALSHAKDGDTLVLAAGTYDIGAGIVIDKDITFEGAGEGATILNATANPAAQDSISTNHGKYPIIFVNNAKVAFSNLTVQTTGIEYPNPVDGITVSGADADITLSNVAVKEIKDTEYWGMQSGRGITVRDGANAIITDCTFESFNKNAIHIYGEGSTATITGCTITGNAAEDGAAQNGVVFQDKATGTVENCNFKDIKHAESTSILIYGEGSAATVTGCTYTNVTKELVYDGGAVDPSAQTK